MARPGWIGGHTLPKLTSGLARELVRLLLIIKICK